MHRLHGTPMVFVGLLLALTAGFGTPLHAAAQNGASQATRPDAATAMPASPPLALDDLEHRTFDFFWKTANPANGLVPDHWPLGREPFSSVAAVGFALTAYPIGVERGWITRGQARERVLATLRFFANAPQGDSEDDDTGYHGFFYHFLDMRNGLRYDALASRFPPSTPRC